MAEEMKNDKLDEAGAPVKPKKDMKGLIKIAMIAVGALVFMGLNIGVTMMLVGGKQDVAAPPSEHGADAAAPTSDAHGAAKEGAAKDGGHGDAKGGDGKSGDGKGGDGKGDDGKNAATYYAFDPPFVVNFQAQDQLRFLQVKVEVMMRDPKVTPSIEKHMPVIRNNLVVLFSSQDFTTISTRVGKDRLRAQALAEIQKVLKESTGQPGVEQVYFTSFVMQ